MALGIPYPVVDMLNAAQPGAARERQAGDWGFAGRARLRKELMEVRTRVYGSGRPCGADGRYLRVTITIRCSGALPGGLSALFFPKKQEGRCQCPYRKKSGSWFRLGSFDGKVHNIVAEYARKGRLRQAERIIIVAE